jgi:magnesium-transporting ATPase (P-type)
LIEFVLYGVCITGLLFLSIFITNAWNKKTPLRIFIAASIFTGGIYVGYLYPFVPVIFLVGLLLFGLGKIKNGADNRGENVNAPKSTKGDAGTDKKNTVPITGSYVAEAILFDGDPIRIKRARKIKKTFGHYPWYTGGDL